MHTAPLDPADDATVTEVVRLWEAAHAVDNPDDPPFCPQWERGRIDHPLPAEPSEFYVARDGGKLVGVLDIGLTLRDNLTSGWMDIVVDPEERRRGIGTALFEVTKERLPQLGRKLLMIWTRKSGPGAEFARRIGAEVGLVEARRRLEVNPETVALAERLLAEARSHTAGYSVVRWAGATPEEYLDGIAYLTGRMSTDAPLDDLAWEAEVYGPERIRERESVFAARGQRSYTTAVVHGRTGQVAGYTELNFDPCTTTHAWQGNTIVDPEHRGHRLGMVLKAENLRYVLEHEPQLQLVSTDNAVSNAHMIAINEALGFRLLDEWCDWQLRL
jgi:GNAT superfamily N-acetyltransferase